MSAAGGPRSATPLAVILGGGGGIGAAVAQALAHRGWRLALVDRDSQRLDQAAAQLPAGASAWQCDLTDEPRLRQTLAQLLTEQGPADMLVHAAGLTHISPFQHTQLEVLRRVMEINFFSVAAATQALLPALLARRGRVVVLSSLAGIAPLVGRTGYCASKYALHGLFETLRSELAATGVTITLVCPNFVDTDFATRGLSGDGQTLRHARATWGRPLAAQALAEQVVRAALARRRLLVAGPGARWAYWIARLAPRFYERQMLQRLGRDFARSAGNGATPSA